MDANATLAEGLVLLHRPAKESPTEHIPTMLDACVRHRLSMKSFHGVFAGNVHQDLRKTRIGKVSGLRGNFRAS
jgi:hypothetical protein